MHLYAFILGRKYLLSIAELCAVIGQSGKIIDITQEALIASFDAPLPNPEISLKQLGGTIKIAEVVSETVASKDTLGEEIARYLINSFQGKETKLVYGISTCSFARESDEILRNTLNIVKKSLTEAGLKSRFINKGPKNPESAAIKGEKLLQKGAEILAINGAKHIYLARTLAIQDFESYSKRDFDRPERDPRLGMLPPKLAQLMINLGGLTTLNPKMDPPKTVYDPFCGLGTVLMEGLFLGYNGIGSDIETEIIEKAKTNIEWVRKFVPYANKYQTSFFAKDATALTKEDLPEEPDLVVTESYLGPPISKIPTEENIQKNFKHIRELEVKFLQCLHPLLKTGTPLIISFPFYRDKNRFIFMDNLIGKITEMGFQMQPLIPEELRGKFNLGGTNQRQSLLYDRPDQIVGREIWKFLK